MKISVVANEDGDIIAAAVPSRKRVELPGEHPMFAGISSEEGHAMHEVDAPEELADREPGLEYMEALSSYRVRAGKLVEKR